MNQLSKEMKIELHKEAQTNGFNATEYRILLGEVDRLITGQAQTTVEAVHGNSPENDYDINGKEIF